MVYTKNDVNVSKLSLWFQIVLVVFFIISLLIIVRLFPKKQSFHTQAAACSDFSTQVICSAQPNCRWQLGQLVNCSGVPPCQSSSCTIQDNYSQCNSSWVDLRCTSRSGCSFAEVRRQCSGLTQTQCQATVFCSPLTTACAFSGGVCPTGCNYGAASAAKCWGRSGCERNTSQTSCLTYSCQWTPSKPATCTGSRYTGCGGGSWLESTTCSGTYISSRSCAGSYTSAGSCVSVPPTAIPTPTPVPPTPVPVANCNTSIPANDYIAYYLYHLTGPESFAAGALRWTGNLGKNYGKECYWDVVNQSYQRGVDPGFTLAVWLHESGASNYVRFAPNPVLDFGVLGSNNNNLSIQLGAFLGLPAHYLSGCSAEISSGKLPMEVFVSKFTSGYCNPDTNADVRLRVDGYIQKLRNIYPMATSDPFPNYPTAISSEVRRVVIPSPTLVKTTPLPKFPMMNTDLETGF